VFYEQREFVNFENQMHVIWRSDSLEGDKCPTKWVLFQLSLRNAVSQSQFALSNMAREGGPLAVFPSETVSPLDFLAVLVLN
jgi:hypothetical protein